MHVAIVSLAQNIYTICRKNPLNRRRKSESAHGLFRAQRLCVYIYMYVGYMYIYTYENLTPSPPQPPRAHLWGAKNSHRNKFESMRFGFREYFV